MRYQVYILALVISLSACVLNLAGFAAAMILAVAVPLALLGTWDMFLSRHNLLRNYPIVGHLRWLLEGIRPQIHQYFIESDTGGRPFDRNQRSIIYERAKNVIDKKPYGTELDVYASEYEWLNHTIAAKPRPAELYRITIGGPQCRRPYSASVFNISAMSFGSLGAKAIQALNKGAKLGGFAHDTGEGGISRYHLENGGDLIWEIGSGYFGCRSADGAFDADAFKRQSRNERVKMVEIKLSQGAKPGHGGVLPGAKVNREIAGSRGIPVGLDCISPSCHSAFATPVGLMEFIAELRELSGGKPIGFKLCIGHRWEFLAICKAMIKTGTLPDFIVVDGSEGGTGA
ncbi:MAG: glutamate synthase-related protein, partial [Gammaproteobacteria bacterium]